MGSTNSIPKYIFGIIAIVLLAIIFIFTVQVPFSKAQPELEKQHQSDASQLKIYQDAYADRVNLASKVSSMKAQYEKDSKELFVNATKSPEDIMKMLNSSKVLPTTYSVSEQVLDDKGRSSSSGEPLYSTNISISFDSLDETQLLTVLDYFESQSEGAYYIDRLTVDAIEKRTNSAITDGTDESSKAESSANTDNKASNGDLNSLYFTGKYDVTIDLMLYYFLPTEQTPDAIKKAVQDASNAAEGSVAAPATSDASGSASAGSSAA